MKKEAVDDEEGASGRHAVHTSLFRVALAALIVAGTTGVPAAQQASPERADYYTPRQDWSGLNGGDMNISTFVYRDRNRNGVYDLGDQAMAGIVVEMAAPRGDLTTARSNINGFANFKMSLTQPDAAVRGAGEYRFAVATPPGWAVTSGNGEQTVEFAALPGSIADMVAVQPPATVGLAPELTVRGRVVEPGPDSAPVGAADARVEAVAPDGTSIEVQTDRDGTFEFTAQPGPWRVQGTTAGGARTAKTGVTVRDAPVHLAAMAVGAPVWAAAPNLRAVGFDDVTPTALGKIPNGHAGLDWDNLNVTDRLLYGGDGYVNGTVSGRFAAYNSSGHPVTITSPERFDFVGGYFAVAWRDAEGETLIVEARRGGAVVGYEELTLSSLGPVWLQADYRGVDTLILRTRHYWQFVADDLTFRSATAVAEAGPETAPGAGP